ncbi:hypothetical protein BYT27DRAFT_6965419 [Phlegmacium glaucopus]|nr:hypothetical protein BYT27DRAFT_6965419 [Phlegmacium glaucopus]
MRSIFVKLLPSSTERSGDWQAIEISDIASITLSIDSLTRHTIFDSAEDKSKEVTLILAPATPILGQLFVSVKQEGLFQRSKDITIRKHDLLYKARSVNTDANEREYRRMTVDGIEIVARFIHQRSKKARKDRPLFTKPPRGELNKTASRAKAHDVKTRPKLYREDSVTWGLGN